MKTFKFYSDGGHGWLAVKRKLLSEFNLLDKITRFSYQRGQTVYLEEDIDAGLFIEAWRARYGNNPLFKEKYFDHSAPMRNYDSFSLTENEI